jgi:hypothetical protein
MVILLEVFKKFTPTVLDILLENDMTHKNTLYISIGNIFVRFSVILYYISTVSPPYHLTMKPKSRPS